MRLSKLHWNSFSLLKIKFYEAWGNDTTQKKWQKVIDNNEHNILGWQKGNYEFFKKTKSDLLIMQNYFYLLYYVRYY